MGEGRGRAGVGGRSAKGDDLGRGKCVFLCPCHSTKSFDGTLRGNASEAGGELRLSSHLPHFTPETAPRCSSTLNEGQGAVPPVRRIW